MPSKPIFRFDNSYARLPEIFYRPWEPVAVAAPRLIAFNRPLAAELGLHTEGLNEEALARIFVGNDIPEGSAPIALAYAGHQFGHFVPQLGDGRALLLGEVVDRNTIRRDIQLKGSGRTPFSRNGDGRAALGPVIREYIVSEAMHALGVPTTRSLAAVTTGEPVLRDTMLPGGVLTRVAASHIRIGTFEYFAAQENDEALRQLADYAIARHYPEAREAENPYAAFLDGVIEAQASLIARWMQVGFIHGVMNTDNMAISGETIDYGPCAFMDHYDPMMVFSSIDKRGRYAFGNQATSAQWNLICLARTLLPLLDTDMEKAIALAEASLEAFPSRFTSHLRSVMRRKLGLFTEQGDDAALIEELLAEMHRSNADYTLTFRLLSEQNELPVLQQFAEPRGMAAWLTRWRRRLGQQPQPFEESASLMRRTNPAYIPRNHRVEQAIAAAVEHDDFTLMKRLVAVLAKPYESQAVFEEYAVRPLDQERVTQTFCGT